jgi:capping protein (actin filament) muscle Z-line, alpha
MAEFAEDEGPTAQEAMQIAQHFILNSPPGQLKDVTSDVKKLLKADVMTEALEMGIARAYNNKNNKIVKSPSGANIVLSSLGEVDATHYVDTSNGSTFAVNHITLETSEDHIDSNMDPSIELKRAALQNAINDYMREVCSDCNSSGCVYAKDGKLQIVLTGEKTNLRNYWGGKWSSTWDIEWDQGSTTCKGEIKVHAHYFEDGNVQLQTTKPVPSNKWAWEFTETQCSDIVNHIKAKENDLHKSLGMMYLNMDAETFKSIRRILPVTKLKMDWNTVRNSLTTTLQAGLKK